jgi:hypothetical protein
MRKLFLLGLSTFAAVMLGDAAQAAQVTCATWRSK